MPLVASPNEPGLWINTDRAADGPGVHALIIGVSRYAHLQGGRDPAANTYGLGQLSVSALTAYRFFSWLRGGYSLEAWPIATMRLLLSGIEPGGAGNTDELTGVDSAVRAHAPDATFANCKRALENWYAEMNALRAPATGRSLFLFSGHGMERRQNSQLLLPSDFLRPPTQPVNESLSTSNIGDALSYLPRVSSHVLFLDGCRNDIDKLRGVVGAKILNDEQAVEANPLFEKAMLFATASGLRAYSPRTGQLSLFGQALLDGLRNSPHPPLDEAPLELLQRGDVARIEVNKLASYMKGRVAALIRAAQENVVQVVRSEVSSPEPGRPIELTEIQLSPPPLPESLHDGPPVASTIWDRMTRRRPKRSRAGPKENPDAWFFRRYQAVRVFPEFTREIDDPVNYFHDIFGSEQVTFPWIRNLKLTALSEQETYDFNHLRVLSSAQAERKVTGLHRLQIQCQVLARDPIGHVLSILDESGRRSCCLLPNNYSNNIFQLEIDVEDKEFVSFAAYLSEDNGGLVGDIARAWNQLRARDVSVATTSVKQLGERLLDDVFDRGEAALARKVEAPLAASVAALLLLKGNELERMHDWARNLANWFQTIPDGVVIWIEQNRRLARGKLDPALIHWFVTELSHRSLPFTADALGLASDLVGDILRGRLKSGASTREAAHPLAHRLEAANSYFRDTGLFAGFSGYPEEWEPHRVLGPLAEGQGPT